MRRTAIEIILLAIGTHAIYLLFSHAQTYGWSADVPNAYKIYIILFGVGGIADMLYRTIDNNQ